MFLFQNDSEPLGEIYQDEDNMAAFLIRKDTENGGIIVVSKSLQK